MLTYTHILNTRTRDTPRSGSRQSQILAPEHMEVKSEPSGQSAKGQQAKTDGDEALVKSEDRAARIDVANLTNVKKEHADSSEEER